MIPACVQCMLIYLSKVHGNVSMLVPMTVTAVACSIEAPPTCSSTATCNSNQQQQLDTVHANANIASRLDSSNSSISSSAGADDNKFVGCLESTFERYWGAKGALHNRQLLAHNVTGIEWHNPMVSHTDYIFVYNHIIVACARC
jgi:hypothetical protein